MVVGGPRCPPQSASAHLLQSHKVNRLQSAQRSATNGSCVPSRPRTHDHETSLPADAQTWLERLGTMDQLGNKPASRYVADLIGLNCFRGTCSGNVLTVKNGQTMIVGTKHDLDGRGEVWAAIKATEFRVAPT